MKAGWLAFLDSVQTGHRDEILALGRQIQIDRGAS
jgi:hypothetical protein